jgi:hypothetical protein
VSTGEACVRNGSMAATVLSVDGMILLPGMIVTGRIHRTAC